MVSMMVLQIRFWLLVLQGLSLLMIKVSSKPLTPGELEIVANHQRQFSEAIGKFEEDVQPWLKPSVIKEVVTDEEATH